MEDYTYITYLGQKILFANYVGLRGTELLQSIQRVTKVMLDVPHNDLLFLGDFTGTYINDEIMAYLSGEESKRASEKTRKMAIVGITGIKKIFLNTYNMMTRSGTRAFNDVESAKQFLVS